MTEWIVLKQHDGERLDLFLSEQAQLTRSRVASLIRAGRASVDENIETKTGFSLKHGMRVSFDIPETAPCALEAEPLHLDILYQDEDLAVVYKPSGMVVHPAAGNWDGTMVNALLYHLDGLSGIGGEARPGIVHRIDKDTSGLLLVAKNDRSHLMLSEQIAAHTVERTYRAVIQGNLKDEKGTIDAPIARHPRDRKKMAVVSGGKNAVTHWNVIKPLKGANLIEARLTTGRTHQIRVHMAHIGHPVLGDPVYGPKKPPFPVQDGQLLHAEKIGFLHPSTGEWMRFEAPPEKRFDDWVKKLRLI